jgi:hypothetical protein
MVLNLRGIAAPIMTEVNRAKALFLLSMGLSLGLVSICPAQITPTR